MRISADEEYTAGFPPAWFLLAEEDTAAFWRLDEGEGDVVRDAVGGSHGVIAGATWVSAP